MGKPWRSLEAEDGIIESLDRGMAIGMEITHGNGHWDWDGLVAGDRVLYLPA